MKKEFKKSEYLYGYKGSKYAGMIYEDAIKQKIKDGEDLRKKLCDIIFSNNVDPEKKTELTERLNDVVNAINFNKKLLEELGDKR